MIADTSAWISWETPDCSVETLVEGGHVDKEDVELLRGARCVVRQMCP